MPKAKDEPGIATIPQGDGGETQQRGGDPLTTNHGVPISDNQNSLKAGVRGPTLLEDFVLREKIFHFDHERIPERIVHARGTGAHGYFECTDPIPDLSTAQPVPEEGCQGAGLRPFLDRRGQQGLQGHAA